MTGDPVVFQIRESQIVILSIWFGATAFNYWIFTLEWSKDKERPETIAKVSVVLLLIVSMPLATVAILGYLIKKWFELNYTRMMDSRLKQGGLKKDDLRKSVLRSLNLPFEREVDAEHILNSLITRYSARYVFTTQSMQSLAQQVQKKLAAR